MRNGTDIFRMMGFEVAGGPSSISATASGSAGRRAVTLIEMLIVLVIVSLLAAATLRALPGEEERPREAARMINLYLSSAKSRAMESGRPAGVILRSTSNRDNTFYCSTLDQCEVPASFSGDTLEAVVRVQDWTFKTNSAGAVVPYDAQSRLVVKAQVRAFDFPNNMLRFGDRVQLNDQGPLYTLLQDPNNLVTGDVPSTPLPNFGLDAKGFLNFQAGTDSNNDGWIDDKFLTLFLDPSPPVLLPWPKSYQGGTSDPIHFKVIRQPIKSGASPMQLPARVGIELAVSGDDANQSFSVPIGKEVVVLFSPTGAIDSISVDGCKYQPTGPVYLLIGKIGNETLNVFDLKNFIVSIQPQTGVISSNNVAPPFFNTQLKPPYPIDHPDPNIVANMFNPDRPPAVDYNNSDFKQSLFYSRKFAREAQTMGGQR